MVDCGTVNWALLLVKTPETLLNAVLCKLNMMITNVHVMPLYWMSNSEKALGFRVIHFLDPVIGGSTPGAYTPKSPL